MGEEAKSGVNYGTLDLTSLSRQAAERSPLAMAAMEGNTHVVRYVNPAFCRLVGKGSEEMVGIPFALAVPETGACLPHLDQVYRTGEAETCVIEEHSALHPLHWSYAVWAVSGTSNRLAGVMIQVTDMKEADVFRERATAMNQELVLASVRQHELTEAAEKLNAVLQEEITERKRAEEALRTSEAQLRQSQKMEALGTMAGGIAHDFNNILAAIIGFTELLQEDLPVGNPGHRHAARVLAAGTRGRDLIQHMLIFSRRTEMEKKPLRLSSIVKESVEFLRASVPTTINIIVNITSESGQILADPVHIQQVLMNICTNATHAMREKGGILDIELNDFSVGQWETNPYGIVPGFYLKLMIRDTGTGIPAHVKDKIFDPFFTTKGVGEGTGLGLSVVIGIVKQSGGYITVESEPGKGSTFVVYFPKVAEGPIADASGGEETLPTGSQRILFVDDEEALLEMGEQILRRLGYEVTCQSSSEAALDLVEENPSRFDLVITDQTVPKMAGVELARRILAIRPDMPIILCTGFSHLVDADSAKAAGIRGFAMKPLTKREIAKTVRNVLDGKNSA